jgi:hypothetical protein
LEQGRGADWLSSRSVPFETLLKPEICDVMKILIKEYTADSLREAFGHFVLRLSPYHPDLNSTKMV